VEHPLIILHTSADTQIKFSDWDVYGTLLYMYTLFSAAKSNQINSKSLSGILLQQQSETKLGLTSSFDISNTPVSRTH
jgi:hypothetical protein